MIYALTDKVIVIFQNKLLFGLPGRVQAWVHLTCITGVLTPALVSLGGIQSGCLLLKSKQLGFHSVCIIYTHMSIRRCVGLHVCIQAYTRTYGKFKYQSSFQNYFLIAVLNCNALGNKQFWWESLGKIYWYDKFSENAEMYPKNVMT